MDSLRVPTLPAPGYTRPLLAPRPLLHGYAVLSGVLGAEPWALGSNLPWVRGVLQQIVDRMSLARRSVKMVSISYPKKAWKDWIRPKGISNTRA